MQVKITRAIENYAKRNTLFHNKKDFENNSNIYLNIGDTVYKSVHNNEIKIGHIGMDVVKRTKHSFALEQELAVTVVDLKDVVLKEITISMSVRGRQNNISSLHEDELRDIIRTNFAQHVFCPNQHLICEHNDIVLILFISNKHKNKGTIDKTTKINLISTEINLNIVSSKLLNRELFKDDYNFEEVGIGGLDIELMAIFRRALSTRAVNPSIIKKLGINHVKGVLLYGPPGTGKTLIAKKIGGLLTKNKPKVVNGPEILNKYVGQSEQNMRDIFAEAVNDYDKNGDRSELHIIIFDEIDAICKKRGSSGTQSGITDSLVSQLLAILEGVNQLNNIFVIAMTNRKDLLDDALLRPGRLEIHVPISLPNYEGRKQIFRIHTNNMKIYHMVSNLDVDKLASLTDNFSGAEIESVVKNASSYALHELLSKSDKEFNDADVIVTMDHFIKAVNETNPAFGNSAKNIKHLIAKGYEPDQAIMTSITNDVTNNTGVRTFLFLGANKTGKTSSVSYVCTNVLNMTYTKFVRGIDVCMMDDYTRSQYIYEIFHNASLCKESLVVFDDIDTIINYANLLGSVIFSNRMYQTLVTILKTSLEIPTNKMCILVTCGNKELGHILKPLFDHTFDINNK